MATVTVHLRAVIPIKFIDIVVVVPEHERFRYEVHVNVFCQLTFSL